jgi:enamine deaminase RidA (YjgF/YER057c/UK114 family)
MSVVRWSAPATWLRKRRRRCAMSAYIVKITTYVVNYKPEHRAVIGKARAPFFASGKPPASTLVGVAALAMPEWLVEIEAIAVTD